MNNALPKIFDNGRIWLAVMVIVLALGQAVMTAVAAFATRSIFGDLYSQSTHFPIVAISCLVVAGIFFALLRCSTSSIAEKLGQSYAIDFRKNFYEHLTRMPISTISEKRNGALALRFVGDLSAKRDWISLGVCPLICAAIVIPGSIIALNMLNSTFAIVTAFIVIVSLILVLISGRFLMPYHRKLRTERARLAIEMMERVSKAPHLRLIGRDKSDFKLINRRGHELKDVSAKREFVKKLLEAIPEIGLSIATASILIICFTLSLSTATAAGGLAIIGILSLPMKDLARVWDLWCGWQIACEKSENIFNQPTIRTSRDTINLEKGSLSISLRNVQAKHLHDINLNIKAASKVGLIGGDGSGRTTLLNIIAGLEALDAGMVLYNHHPSTMLKQSVFTKRFHYLTMEAPVLQGSLRRTLSFGLKKRPNDEDLEAIAIRYGLSSLLNRLGGLSGRISEEARNISKGERFRILMVRAHFSNADLILIDDPNDMIDVAGRKLLRQFIKDSHATMVLATNDEKILENIDQYVVLKYGRLTVKPETCDGWRKELEKAA